LNYLDYIIIAIVLIGFILGFKDGLVRKLVGLVGLVAAVLLAYEFADSAGKLLAPLVNNELSLAKIISAILIFLFVIFIFAVIKRIVHPVDRVNMFLNQILGGMLGAVQIVFFLSGFLLFLNIFNYPGDADRDNSKLYVPTYKVVPETIDFFLGTQSELKKYIRERIEKEDELPDVEFPDDSIDGN
jgi:membrane protein required for colicin V production